ncbi:MAG: hypothetical protein LBF89_00195 [Bacteroidales bacterium]|jgi:uncharacterized protein (TIGR02145 family)|nr:hypothetical protein [Bacteroidales bacterium]
MNKDKIISDTSVSDTVVINGLKWDRENTVIEEREHLNWYEAIGVAQASGKRLPTKEEWEALIALGSTWDDDRKGRWFGNDHKLKADSKESIFLPAAGHRNRSGGAQNGVGSIGTYWSSAVTSTTSYYLYFTSGSINAANTTNRAYGLTVRCVADI